METHINEGNTTWPNHPTPEVFKGAKAIAKKLNDFLKKNNLEINYDLASDKVYLIPKNGWNNTNRQDVVNAMKASGNILNTKDLGKKWGWFRGSCLDENWFCNKGDK
mgnify:FL=1